MGRVECVRLEVKEESFGLIPHVHILTIADSVPIAPLKTILWFTLFELGNYGF